MSEEETRAIAVEAVKRHLEISDKTRATTSVKNAAAICVTIIATTWAAAWAVGNYLHDIRDSQTRIESALSYKVSIGQFTTWATALDRSNRGLQNKNGEPGLAVPDLPILEKHE